MDPKEYRKQIAGQLAQLAARKGKAGAFRDPTASSEKRFEALQTLGVLSRADECPLCWAAYVSVLGFAGLESLPYPRFAAPLLFGLVLVNVLAMFLRARARGSWWPFACALAGALLLFPLALGERMIGLTLPGLSLTFFAAIAGIAGRRRWPVLRAL